MPICIHFVQIHRKLRYPWIQLIDTADQRGYFPVNGPCYQKCIYTHRVELLFAIQDSQHLIFEMA